VTPPKKKSRAKSPKLGRGAVIPTKQGKLIAGAGRGPAKGAPNAGRPPDQWKAALRALADRQEVLDHIDAALKAGPADPFFEKALDYVTDHGYGKATQPVQHDATQGLADILTKMASSP
jgi:hypothetical protein